MPPKASSPARACLFPLAALLAAAVGGQGGPAIERTTLEGRQEVLLVDLGQGYSAAYDIATCALHSLSSGSEPLIVQDPELAGRWIYGSRKNAIPAVARYRGFRRRGDDVFLQCELSAPGGATSLLEETLVIEVGSDGGAILRRNFNRDAARPDDALFSTQALRGIGRSDVRADGGWRTHRVAADESGPVVAGTLRLDAGQRSTMRIRLPPTIVPSAPSSPQPATSVRLVLAAVGSTTVPPSAEAPRIDGELEEIWLTAAELPLELSSTDGVTAVRATMKALTHDDGLFLALDAVDERTGPSERTCALAVGLDAGNEQRPGWRDDNDLMVFAASGAAAPPAGVVDPVGDVRSLEEWRAGAGTAARVDGCSFELRLPWSLLQLDHVADADIGFALAFAIQPGRTTGSALRAFAINALADTTSYQTLHLVAGTEEVTQRQAGLRADLYELGSIGRERLTPRLGVQPNRRSVVDGSALRIPLGVMTPASLLARLGGFLEVERTGTYGFRLASSAPATLYLDNREIMMLEGLHPPRSAEVDLPLAAGTHRLRVEAQQAIGTLTLDLGWRPPGAESFVSIPRANLWSPAGTSLRTSPGAKPALEPPPAPAETVGWSMEELPAPSGGWSPVALATVAGRALVASCERAGRVFALTAGEEPGVIASGLERPYAMTAVGEALYVAQHSELTQLLSGDGAQPETRQWAYAGWEASGLMPSSLRWGPQGFVVAASNPDGASTAWLQAADGPPQPLLTVQADTIRLGGPVDGSFLALASGAEGTEIYRLPAEAQTAPEQAAALVARLPVSALARPTAPRPFPAGPFAGEYLVADATSGRLVRLAFQNGLAVLSLLPFGESASAPVHDLLVSAANDVLVAAGAGPCAQRLEPPGEEATPGTLWRLRRQTSTPDFEILAVRAFANGIEIELSAPLGGAEAGWHAGDYRGRIVSWEEGSVPMALVPRSASLSADRRKIFLQIPEMRARTSIELELDGPFFDRDGRVLTTHGAWLSIAELPAEIGEVRPGPMRVPINDLSVDDADNGWTSLFDGESLRQWRGYRSSEPGPGWTVEDGWISLHPQADGERVDLMTRRQYDDFELYLEWVVAPGSNSGIMFRVSEDQPSSYNSGPEYQLLDDAGHRDGGRLITSAGSDYAMHEPFARASRGPGRVNHSRLLVRDGYVEHWLNGYRLLGYELGSDEWERRFGESKFRDMPRYGRNRRGYIVLQHHGDPIWFRNIRIRTF